VKSILAALLFLIAHPCSSIPIGYGDCVLDSVKPAGDRDTLTFSGTSGDVVIVRMARISGDIAVRIEVYDPAWSSMADEWGIAYVSVDTLPLVSTGTHAIVASDYTGFGTGPYGISLQRTFNPGGSSPIGYGATLEDSLTLVTEMNAYTFAADSGDRVTARMSWASGGILPYLRAFDPAGRMVAEDFSYPKPMIDTLLLESTGTYTLIACDQYGPWYGSYGLSLQRTFGPEGGDTIAYHYLVEDSITEISQMKAYVFYGIQWELIQARMYQPTQGLTPYLELYTPSGDKYAEDWGTIEAIIGTILGSTGWFTILASDHTGPERGGFLLEVQGAGIAEHRQERALRGTAKLLSCFPNPFAGSTVIEYAVALDEDAIVSVCDVAGRMVCTLASGWHLAGEHVLPWDGRDDQGERVPAGVYFVTVESGGIRRSERMVHLR
jgi:hypothetical protein